MRLAADPIWNDSLESARADRRRRLLLLLPFAPRRDAAHGGGRVLAEVLARLAQRHALAILHLRASEESPIDEILCERCEVVEEVVRPSGGLSLARRWSRRGRLLAALLGGRPLWVSAWSVPAFATRARVLARTWRPEIVQLEYLVMGQYLDAVGDCRAPRVLTEHEPAADLARGLEALRRGVGRWMARLEGLAWVRFERRILARVQAAVVFTERDRRVLQTLAPSTPLVTIPLGTTLPERPLDPLGSVPSRLVFAGSLFHPSNLDAAQRLVRDILPRVRLRCSDASLDIVGDRPPERLCRLASPNVAITGLVPDAVPYLDRAAVVVVPVRFGGGMRVKVLEAMAAGKALVASPRAVEGLDLRDGDQVLLAETDQQFCDAVVRLLRDPQQRAALATRARAWACANLDWDRSVAAYEALYASLLDRSVEARKPRP